MTTSKRQAPSPIAFAHSGTLLAARGSAACAWACPRHHRLERREAVTVTRAPPPPLVTPCVTHFASASTSTPTSTPSVSPVSPMTLQSFVERARDLGTIRFIAISNGAVLETVGRFDYSLSEFSIPGKGDYVTLASVDKTFECHVNLSKVHALTLSTEPAKVGDYDLHVIRLRGADDAVVLSCLLMFDPSQGPGHYLDGAVDAFNRLRDAVGPRVSLLHSA